MADDGFPRRKFLLGAGVAGTAIAAGIAEPLEAQQPAPAASPAAVSPQEPEPFVTLTALNDALRATILEGASLASQSGRILVLVLWGGICFALALRWFRWT